MRDALNGITPNHAALTPSWANAGGLSSQLRDVGALATPRDALLSVLGSLGHREVLAPIDAAVLDARRAFDPAGTFAFPP